MSKASKLAIVVFATLGLTLATNAGAAGLHNRACEARILKSYPNGTWLENLAQDHRGRLFFSVMSDRKIDIYEPGKGVRHFADLPIYPMGIAILSDKFVIAGNRRPMADGAATLTTNAVAELSLAGQVRRVTDVNDACMLNGVVLAPGGGVLIADSRAGTIWRYDPNTGATTAWLKDDLLSAPAGAPAAAVGANGLKIFGDQLLISNTGRGAVLSVRVSANGAPAGPVTTFQTTGVVDDFDVTADGSLYVAPYKTNIVRFTRSGTTDVVLPSGAEGATAVSLVGSRAKPTSFYVLTTGNLLFGGKDPAKLLQVRVPDQGACNAPAKG